MKNFFNAIMMFLLLKLIIFDTFFSVSIVDFQQVNVSWDHVPLSAEPCLLSVT